MWRALRVGDSGLVGLKTDPLIDPLRNKSRFQAIERGVEVFELTGVPVGLRDNARDQEVETTRLS